MSAWSKSDAVAAWSHAFVPAPRSPRPGATSPRRTAVALSLVPGERTRPAANSQDLRGARLRFRPGGVSRNHCSQVRLPGSRDVQRRDACLVRRRRRALSAAVRPGRAALPALARRRSGVLRARALLRLGRAHDALRALERAAAAGATARRLAHRAHAARRGSGAAGSRSTRVWRSSTRRRPTRWPAAPTPRCARRSRCNRGLAHYGLRELDAAQAALREVGRDADVIHAAGLNYARLDRRPRAADYPAAIELFVASLRRLDGCRRYDRPLEANSLQTLSAFAVERLDRALWQFVAARAARELGRRRSGRGAASGSPWRPATWKSSKAATPPRCGRPGWPRSWRPRAAYRVQARLRRAAISRLLGERASQARPRHQRARAVRGAAARRR